MASYQYIYVMKGLSKIYPGGKQAIKDVWLSFFPDAKIGVIGKNGTGKSTLLKIMAGIDTEFQGEAWAAKGASIGYLAQEPQLDETKTVLENVMLSVADQKKILDEYELISARFCEELTDDEMNALLVRQAELQDRIDALDLWDLQRNVEIAMQKLGCPSGERSIDTLSGGEKRRVALCKLLMSKPDLLLLDEPTNHLDAEAVMWLEKFLKEYKGAVVLVTHDRYFLDNVVGWILELDKGTAYPFEGNYSQWLENKQKRIALEEKHEADRKNYLDRELEWVRMSVKGRQAKSKARLNAYDVMLKDVAEVERFYETAKIYIPSGPRLGNVVIKADKIAKSFGNKVLFKDLSFCLPPNGIVGVIGANGAGKSTLFKVLTGQEKLDAGCIEFGETVKLAYVSQERNSLDDRRTVWEEVADGLDWIELGKHKVNSRAYVSNFGFKGTDQQKFVNQLSGGERNRLHLAKTLKIGGNLILLDEPTNDLDVDTIRALEDGLINFAGCAVIISHDRWFLDRIATHILAFKDEKVDWFEGGFTAYEDYLRENVKGC